MPAPRGMSEFQGFEDPPLNVNAPSWEDRLIALSVEYPSRWAKYGPYASKKSVQNVVSHIRNSLHANLVYALKPQFQVATVVDQGPWYLYIKVGETNGVPKEEQLALFDSQQ